MDARALLADDTVSQTRREALDKPVHGRSRSDRPNSVRWRCYRARGHGPPRSASLWDGHQVIPDVRIRRLLAVAALLAGFGVALPRFLTHGPYPRLGARIAQLTGI